MKYGRKIGALAMCAMAAAALVSFTAAREEEAAPRPEVRQTLPVTLPQEAEAPAERAPLLLTVRDLAEDPAQSVSVTDAGGVEVCTAAPDRRGESVLSLPPGQSYTLTGDDGRTVQFTLEENASVSRVSGDGWTDGELLCLDRQPRCTLHLLGTVAEEPVVYTLDGGDGPESRTLYAPPGETVGRASFAGLLPGTYTLTGSDGTERTVQLREDSPEVTLGLD